MLLAPRTVPLIASATIAKPRPHPNARIKPKNIIADLLGLTGFSGRAAGSINVNDTDLATLQTLNAREAAICLIVDNNGTNEWRVSKYRILGKVEAVGYKLILFPAVFEEGSDPRKAKISQYIDYEYSDNGNLKSEKSYYIYDGNNQLVNYSEYEYENEKVVKIKLFNPQDQLSQYYTYLYDSNGNVSKEEYYYIQDGAEAILQTRILYEYDDKNNPFIIFAVEGTPGINTNRNNITKQTTINYYTEGDQSYTVENSYEYNYLGYPVKANNFEYIYGEGE